MREGEHCHVITDFCGDDGRKNEKASTATSFADFCGDDGRKTPGCSLSELFWSPFPPGARFVNYSGEPPPEMSACFLEKLDGG